MQTDAHNTHTNRHTQTDTQSQIDRQRYTDTVTLRQTDTQKCSQIYKYTNRHTETYSHTHSHTHRNTDIVKVSHTHTIIAILMHTVIYTDTVLFRHAHAHAHSHKLTHTVWSSVQINKLNLKSPLQKFQILSLTHTGSQWSLFNVFLITSLHFSLPFRFSILENIKLTKEDIFKLWAFSGLSSQPANGKAVYSGGAGPAGAGSSFRKGQYSVLPKQLSYGVLGLVGQGSSSMPSLTFVTGQILAVTPRLSFSAMGCFHALSQEGLGASYLGSRKGL